MVKIAKIIILFFVLGFFPISVDAATLSFSQNTSSYTVGQTLSVNIYTNSSDQSMNAVSAVISFPSDKLQVVSLSKTGSILSLWAEEPSFSNSSGTVNFEGIVLNPGFTGVNGKVLTINFKTKAVGQANLSFSSGSVLANDGNGTNILKSLGGAVINIGSPAIVPNTEPPAVVDNTPETNSLALRSSTHPVQTKWYSNSSPEFSWTLPAGALEVRTSITAKTKGTPKVSYIPPISGKKVDALSDGTYYFNLQARTASGWGGTSHYRVNIDTTDPKSFTITFPNGKSGFDPQPLILFDTSDDLSGISHYEVKIGDGRMDSTPKRVASNMSSNPYPLPPQDPGAHVVVVTAFDYASNSVSASSDFTIESIEMPTIISYPQEIVSGDLIKIIGKTYADSDLDIFIYQDKKLVHQEQARSNSLGDFSSVITKQLSSGVYYFTARVTDGDGAKSKETVALSIIVKSKLSTDIITFILEYLSLSLLLILVLGGLVGLGIFMWYKLSKLVRHFRQEATEAEKIVEKAFTILRKDIDRHITRLNVAKDKRKLTKDEISFLETFEKNLNETEKVVSDKLKDISKS